MATSLNVHCLQHVPFEGPAGIADWLAARRHRLTFTHLYRGETLPTMEKFDWLVIMGGPMNIYEHRFHSWLREEKLFIDQAIRAGKTVLGVCLGAQLLADVLGGKVYQNMDKEIGWLPITLQDEAGRFFPGAPKELTVFHWHGDTFSLPGSVCLASSKGCAHQAFAHGDRVVGLQFHIEMTPAGIAALAENCGNELTDGKYIQTAAEITGNHAHFAANRQMLAKLLERLEATTLRGA
jgi:GMP synthase-like glutamine amidotransferase